MLDVQRLRKDSAQTTAKIIIQAYASSSYRHLWPTEQHSTRPILLFLQAGDHLPSIVNEID